MRTVVLVFLACSCIIPTFAQSTDANDSLQFSTFAAINVSVDSVQGDTTKPDVSILRMAAPDSIPETAVVPSEEAMPTVDTVVVDSIVPLRPAYVTLFDEQFEGGQYHWDILRSSRRGAEIKEGKYHLKGKSKSSENFYGQKVKIRKGKDFQIETAIIHKNGANNMAYGLCWGRSEDQQDYYVFMLSANGKYTILKKKRGEYRKIKTWTESKIVRKSGKENLLAVFRVGNIFEYYINGRKIFTSKAESLKGDQVGFVFHGSMKLQVDYLTVKEENTLSEEE